MILFNRFPPMYVLFVDHGKSFSAHALVLSSYMQLAFPFQCGYARYAELETGLSSKTCIGSGSTSERRRRRAKRCGKFRREEFDGQAGSEPPRVPVSPRQWRTVVDGARLLERESSSCVSRTRSASEGGTVLVLPCVCPCSAAYLRVSPVQAVTACTVYVPRVVRKIICYFWINFCKRVEVCVDCASVPWIRSHNHRVQESMCYCTRVLYE